MAATHQPGVKRFLRLLALVLMLRRKVRLRFLNGASRLSSGMRSDTFAIA